MTPPPDGIQIGEAGVLRGLWGGGRCVETNENGNATLEDEGLLLDLIVQYGVCQETDFDVEAARAEEALSVWTEVPLAEPEPVIEPGWMVVGKPAFLEPNTSLGPLTASVPSPVGELELRAESSYRVNWDDSRDPGWHWYAVEGAPWPDGRITHLYQDAGSYDVTVEQVWEASWRAGGGSWQRIPLERQRSATLPDFEVIEVQAVRER